jgi:dienelactone hydrolase
MTSTLPLRAFCLTPLRRQYFWVVVVLVAVLVALEASPAEGQEPLLWGDLKPGPHAVGYRRLYQLDQTRQYDPEFTTDPAAQPAHRPRPILICIWYPAQKTGAKPMEYRQYLDVSSDDPQLASFVQRLTHHFRAVVCEETIGKSPGKLTPPEATAFDRLLATKTFAVKDAPAAAGRFPVVIYHPGVDGTSEDNSALFEYLASHGYVVLSSHYQGTDGVKGGGGDLPCTFRDMEFLSRYARGLTFADADRLGAMGHSYGAWAIFAWAAEEDSALRAFITLDSGLEYDSVETSGVEALKCHMKENKDNIRAPSLRFASRERKANFDYLEPYLKDTPHYEATVVALKHNDYLTHGAMGPALLPEKWPDAKKARRQSYDRVCEHVLYFLDATLNRQAAARTSLERSVRGEGLDEGFKLQFKPAAPLPPTARQLSQYVRQYGAEKAVELMRSFGGTADAASAAARVLLEDGDAKTAISLLTLLEKDNPKLAPIIQALLGETRALTGDREGALAAFRKGQELMAGDTTVHPYWKEVIEEGLKELGQSEPSKEGR